MRNRRLEEMETAMREVFQDDSAVIAAYLFGSWAKGRPAAHSDVDVGVLLRPEWVDKDRGCGWEEALARRCGWQVEVILLHDASVFLRMQVLKKGRPVVVRDPAALSRFVAGTLIEAGDFLPFWERLARRVASRRVTPVDG